MATLKRSVVGREVFDKVHGLPGVVAREDGLTLVIRFFDAEGNDDFKIVSARRFREDFRFTDGEYNLADRLLGSRKTMIADERPKGAIGCGRPLCNSFIKTVEAYANQDLEITSDSIGRNFVVRYNGFVVFRVYVAKRSLNVACNEKSLSPQNKRYRFVLKGRRSCESAQFVFTKPSDAPLMRSIIVDGLYYRQIIDEGD